MTHFETLRAAKSTYAYASLNSLTDAAAEGSWILMCRAVWLMFRAATDHCLLPCCWTQAAAHVSVTEYASAGPRK